MLAQSDRDADRCLSESATRAFRGPHACYAFGPSFPANFRVTRRRVHSTHFRPANLHTDLSMPLPGRDLPVRNPVHFWRGEVPGWPTNLGVTQNELTVPRVPQTANPKT